MIRKTALVTHERRDFGGSYFDSFTHARMFKEYGPYNFGVKMAQFFSQELGDHQVNKKFTFYTIAQGNRHVLPAGTNDYCWYVGHNAEVEFRITELLVDPASLPGKGNVPFKIALDKDWLHEPAVIRLNMAYGMPLLRILGHGVQRSANSYEYEVVIQDGDVNTYIPVAELQPDRTAVRATSFVSDELNYKYAPDQYGDMFKLQSFVSQYANKAEFTDKFIRMEIGARKNGQSVNGSYKVGGKTESGSAISSGYVYQVDARDKNTGKEIKQGVFITAVEARLEERTMMDREMAMQFGRLEITTDRDSGRPIKIAPGWEQLVQEGHVLEHNGSLSLDQLFEFINNIFVSKRGFKNRKIRFSGGEAAIRWLNKLLYEQYSALLTLDTHFVQKTTSDYNSNSLKYGAQFTEFIAPNGIEISIDYDPMKDNRSIYKVLAPGTNSTLESYALDIYDFGVTDMNAARTDSQNMTMVQEDLMEEFYHVNNVVNFETGVISDGSNAFGNSKELGIYRGMSGSLCIWDTERVGRIQFNPYI